MSPGALYGISIILSFIVWGVIAARYVWPALRGLPRANALRPLLLVHSFRFAGATSLLRFASTVVVLPNYNPAVLADQAASLDLRSNGRFVLGVGAGWDPAELAAVGEALDWIAAEIMPQLDGATAQPTRPK